MVEYTSHELDQVFSALADPTRRAILGRLRDGDVSVSEIAAPFDMSLAAVSKHLDVLERAGLLTREARGRERRCHLDALPLRAASDWASDYRRFWEERLDALDRLLRDRKKRKKASGRKPARSPRKNS